MSLNRRFPPHEVTVLQDPLDQALLDRVPKSPLTNIGRGTDPQPRPARARPRRARARAFGFVLSKSPTRSPARLPGRGASRTSSAPALPPVGSSSGSRRAKPDHLPRHPASAKHAATRVDKIVDSFAGRISGDARPRSGMAIPARAFDVFPQPASRPAAPAEPILRPVRRSRAPLAMLLVERPATHRKHIRSTRRTTVGERQRRGLPEALRRAAGPPRRRCRPGRRAAAQGGVRQSHQVFHRREEGLREDAGRGVVGVRQGLADRGA